MNRFIATLCLFFCWFSAKAEVEHKAYRYSDGTVIEGMVEDKVFVDGPILIYSENDPESFKFLGNYQKETNHISGTWKCGDYFTATCEATFYAEERKSTFGKKPVPRIPISDAKVEGWVLRNAKFIQLLSVPNSIKAVYFLDDPTHQKVQNGSSYRLSDLFKIHGHYGIAQVQFQNGNIYEGIIHCTDPFGFEISNTQSDKIKFKWSNGDFFEGSASIHTATGTCVPYAPGSLTYANGETIGYDVFESNYKQHLEWKEENQIHLLYEQGKAPTEVKEYVLAQISSKLQQKQEKQRQEQLAQEAKAQAKKQRYATCIQQYGQEYGTLIYNGKVKLGMTREMCKMALNGRPYKLSEALIEGQYVEIWKLYSINLFGIEPEYTVFYFVDGKLVAYE